MKKPYTKQWSVPNSKSDLTIRENESDKYFLANPHKYLDLYSFIDNYVSTGS